MKTRIKKPIFIIFAVFCLFLYGCQSDKEFVKVKFGEKTFRFETALTSQQRAKGLMYRTSLDKNGGMLFVYSYPQVLTFYMRNTIIPLDIAFIDKDGIIVNIEEMEPLDETTVASAGKAMYALEVSRGFYKKHNIQPGDKAEILTPLQYTLQ